MNFSPSIISILSGTVWSAVAHIITAIIGAGVLSLAWSTSQLGWIAGPVVLIFCAFVTCISSFLLSDCYRSLDPVTGKRNYCYMDAVRIYLGSFFVLVQSLYSQIQDMVLVNRHHNYAN